ncbi:MAG TPA: hypothetical protein VMY77_08190 [Chitinophagaceae bacterium]|nr:hypothetical protein [Chitinophagaceae bacterium]
MEVHKHPHHVTHKKKWYEYLLEFLMIFFAVFLGFIAENIREHSVEGRREKEYIISLVEDLKTDTAKFAEIISFNESQVKGLDSLANYSFNIPYSDSAVQYMYYLQRKWGSFTNDMTFTKRTITQLQNAGGMHLIRNRIAADSIVRYYEKVTEAENQIKVFVTNFQTPALQSSYWIYNRSYYKGISRGNANLLISGSKKLTLITKNIPVLINYANQIQTSQGVLSYYCSMLTSAREYCIQLIKTLQKEYHLENE